MASKNYIELKEWSVEELTQELSKREEQYKKVLFDHAVKGLDNPLVIREERRDIARLKTMIRVREIGSMTEEQLSKRTKIVARRKR